MRRIVRALSVFFIVLPGAASVAGGQVAPGAPPAAATPPNARRQELEQQLRQRTGQLVKQRLELTDDQMSKLQATNRQFEQQRADLLKREKETRQELRAQLTSGDTANQARVSQLLDQQLQLQRQRIDLIQNEQRELGKFLTPVQRAKYFGLQNEIRRRAQALRAAQGANAQMRAPLNRPLNRPLNGQLNGARRPPRGVLKQ